jgi:hypothetical protein
MLSLFESEKFQSDLYRYQTEIAKITDEDTKNKCNNFLNKLISQVKTFDKDHEQMIFSRDIRDNTSVKQDMLDVRKALERKIEEYKKIQTIKSKQSS